MADQYFRKAAVSIDWRRIVWKKLARVPEDAREKFRETLERIINESTGGLICILL